MRHFTVLLLLFLLAPLAQAQLPIQQVSTPPPQQQVTAPDAEDVDELLRLLGDQQINQWLRDKLVEAREEDNKEAGGATLRELANRRLQAVRARVADVADATTALPGLPQELSERWTSGMTSDTTLRSVIYLIIFVFIGCGLEWLYWCYATLRLKQLELSNVSGLAASSRRAVSVGLLRLGGATVFSVGCIGTYLFFDWPDLAGKVVLSVLFIAVVLRMVLVLARVIFSPASDHLRMVPMERRRARHAVRWIFAICAVGLAGSVAADTFTQLDISDSGSIALRFTASLALALAVIAAIWRWRETSVALADNDPADAQFSIAERGRNTIVKPLLWSALALVVLAMDTLGMHQLMWLLVTAALLVPTLAVCRRLVNYYFDRATAEQIIEPQTVESLEDDVDPPPETTDDAVADDVDDSDSSASSHYELYRPVTQRMVRFVVIVLAILLLFALMGLPVWELYSSSNTAGKLVSAAIDITAVLLMGDLLWVWAKTLIDRRMADYEAPAHGQTPGPGARMATLLPLFRKIVFAVIAIMVVLVVLSSLGVNIAPLIAGAGVIGIAIGFGAQALVKDIVSGVFFLLEDAFRVGEYIEMGDLRGTVESISVRSLRLRHHLGAIHTIPYGELASLTNHSRDWAIIKMEFRVPFETDLKLVKKIVKKIGAELQQNEVYGHHIIEPLKSQGVRRMEEFNMVVGVKFMSAPGQQWTIRRDAYQAIRDAFDKNGLSFAERSVKVEVVGDPGANRDAIVGAAQDAIEDQLNKPPPVVDDTP
jgi:small-conductance mechanosensitive channel